jgi:flavin reductase (DIM6/NTAB) family NADH-FMN oxidoreductase RutF
VVLITSRIKVGRSELSPGLCARGVTVSSFNTVTLDPRPIVSFNLKVPSRSWDAIQQSQKLRIHLLEASERGAAIAQVFTKPYERPEMGFTELRKLGVGVKVTRSNSAPVVQDEQGAVLARLEAELLPEKCVEVGDHVVVLAEVTGVDYETEREGSANGLAYAKRAYRTCGSEVDPENVTARTQDGLYDALSLDGTGSEPQASAPRSRDEGAANVDSEDPHASFKLDHDPIYSALRATKDAAESGEDLDIYAAMAWEDEGLDNSDFTVRNPNREAPRNPSTANEVSTGSSDTNYTPLSSSSGRREFSAISRVPGSTRNFSSTATAQRDDEDRASTLDPSAKNTTVADFLGIPDDNKPLHSPRVRSLLRFQKEIQKAESRLSREELREEDVAALHGTVAYQERIIARKIAWNAAADLRLMLDKGSARVDFKRAQWLESAVEQGLKVLLEDARTLRQRREEGKVNAESYEVLKNKLESDYGVLQTELMRLRGVVDEDEEGGSE